MATFVRELRIVDHGQPVGSHIDVGGADEPAPFDSALVPPLLETLNMLDGVVSVVFEGTKLFPASVHFPGALWDWLSRLQPEKVSFDGDFVFPFSLESLPSVQSMSLLMGVEAAKVIEVGSRSLLFLGGEANPR